jgi:hypothetical protein
VSIDAQEARGGGLLRDRYGRRELVIVEKHRALRSTDTPSAGTVMDRDGREQVVLLGGLGEVHDVKAHGAVGSGVSGPVDDTAAIQEAIDAAEAAPYGGAVYLPAGVYRTSAPLTVKSDNVMLIGVGPGFPKGGLAPDPLFGGSVIRPLPTFSGAWVLDCAFPTASTRALGGSDHRHFAVDGFYLPPGVGGIRHQAFSSTIENVHVVRCTGDGIYSEAVDHVTTWPKGAWDVKFLNVKCDGNAGHNLRTSPGSTDHIITNGIFEYAGGHGLFLEGSGTQVGDCDIYNNTGYGLRALTRSLAVGDCRFTDNNGAIYLYGDTGDGADFNLSDLKIRSNSYSGDGVWDGITVAPTSAVRGGFIGGINFSTLQRNGPANRMRYGINVGQYMNDLVLGPYSMGFISPATSTFTLGAVLDDGVNTKRLDALARAQILTEAQ